MVWRCGPPSPTMFVYHRKVQESSGCSVHEAGCLRWSSVEVSSNTNEEIDWLVRVGGWKQAKRENFFFRFLPIGCYQQMWPGLKCLFPPSKIRIKNGSSHFKRFS